MLVNQSRKELRQWLAPPNPSINHNTACNTQHDGTAEWFIQGSTFDQWKTNGSLLWIRGNPGSGKSILCSAIIEEIKHIRKSRSALVAYYYFDFKDVAKRDVRGLLTSLLLQLVDGSDPCWDLLCQLHKTCCDGLEQPSEAALAQCLDSMLDLPFQIPTYIIIDALDECPNNTGTPSARERVLNFVQDLVQSNHSNLSICITSRPEHDINTALNPLTPPSRRVSLHEEGGQVEDINNFVRFFVLNDRTMRRWRAEDKELVIRVLSERAQGMFRWVYCQLDTLRRCVPSSIRKALNELPITLDDTYERILQGIPEEKFQHARRLFQCIVAAIRPLRVEELAEIFAIEFGPDAGPNLKEGWRPENPEDAVLSAISTLITIVENRGSKIVQFSHFSAREFLMSDRLRTSEIGNIRHYYVPLDAAYTVLARACLTVLLQLDENADKRHLETFPLAFYAAQHWVEHTMYEGVASRFKVHIEQLFNPSNPYLAAWTWIHDVDSDQVRETIDVLEERPTRPKATALYYAVLCGFSGLANYLIITHGEDVNAKCGYHGSSLHAASYMGHLDDARLLLAHGADVNMTNKREKTPLCSAYDGGHLGVMRLLLEYGADVDPYYDIASGLLSQEASFRGQADVVHLLLEHNADVNTRNVSNETPLHAALYCGLADVAGLLLQHGVDVNIRNVSNDTPLHVALYCGQADVVRLLLQHDADVNARNVSNDTPLHAASFRGLADVVYLLLQHNADVNARNVSNETRRCTRHRSEDELMSYVCYYSIMPM
ncbi:ankyrin repeat-containing domain protein [Russula emetica]|nr:ankyrin repeat-containing domain protein [Russula emetica]